MNSNYKITEGFKVGDLEDVVKPRISIDEYSSKIDDDAIVVALYLGTGSNQPAKDLEEFIETGKNGVLDAEVSPGPDEDSNYVLFVEYERNEDFPKNLEKLLYSLRSLTLVEDWTYSFYGNIDEDKDFNIENISKDIRLRKEIKNDAAATINESINFFKESNLDNIEISKNSVVFYRKNGEKKLYENVAFGDINTIFSVLKLDNSPVKLDIASLHECRKLQTFLGDYWNVNKIDDYIVLSNGLENRVMVIK